MGCFDRTEFERIRKVLGINFLTIANVAVSGLNSFSQRPCHGGGSHDGGQNDDI